MKTALIAAVVSAVAAAASSTAATFVVTSKNIKNGSIQAIDLSANAKLALKRQPRRAWPRRRAGATRGTGHSRDSPVVWKRLRMGGQG